jgi:mRNA interferase MazF
MKRGELWTASASAAYVNKPRPVLILQADDFDATLSITVCGLTTGRTAADYIRVVAEPDENNGLRLRSWVMTDKIVTIPKAKLGRRIGRLSRTVMQDIERSIAVFLGLT